LQTPADEKEKYTITYWKNNDEQIVLVRLSDTVVQGWKSKGKELDKDFEHSHFQTTYPSRERLDEYLKAFEPSDIDAYLALQFTQHQFDDHFRRKANEFKDKRYKEEGKV